MRPIDADALIEFCAERWIPLNIDAVNMQPTIQPEKAQLSKEGATSDLISRQAALGCVRSGQVCGDFCKRAIDSLPPVQTEPQWIPVSERLPEEHEWIGTKKFGTTISDEVYVTFENEKGERFCQHMSFQNGELSRYDQFHMDTLFKGSKPIAWMPLPEPYKPNK